MLGGLFDVGNEGVEVGGIGFEPAVDACGVAGEEEDDK